MYSIYTSPQEEAACTKAITKSLKSLCGLSTKCSITNGNHGLRVIVVLDGAPNSFIGSFVLAAMPNCCGAAIITDVQTAYDRCNKGIGTVLHAGALLMLKRLDFSRAICTDTADNEPVRKILKKFGWENAHSFKNINTGNTIIMSVYNLRQRSKKLTCTKKGIIVE